MTAELYTKRRFRVLIAEDNPADATLMRIALGESGIAHEVHVAKDGQEVLDNLRGATKDSRPHLIILDVKMPRKSDHEVLQELKADADLAAIPVVIFSSSQAPQDVKR